MEVSQDSQANKESKKDPIFEMVDIDEAKEAVMGGEQHAQSKGPQNQAKGSGW